MKLAQRGLPGRVVFREYPAVQVHLDKMELWDFREFLEVQDLLAARALLEARVLTEVVELQEPLGHREHPVQAEQLVAQEHRDAMV